ncbi:sensor histidine kinase [Amycolatopsis minnesotensis]|uniref:histidine kinase n=1 Tax=Amycolatopsis minnesotensis TaxID=337894 RepID=A0ABN2QFN3_9PSEU
MATIGQRLLSGLRRQGQHGRTSLELAGLSLVTLLSALITLLGLLGLFFGLVSMTTSVIENSRELTNGYRRGAKAWAGITIEVPYRAQPGRQASEPDWVRKLRSFGGPALAGQRRRAHHLLGDPATWRDLVWMLLNPIAAVLCGLLPLALVMYGYAFLAGPAVWVLVSGHQPYAAPTGFWDAVRWPTSGMGDLVWLAIPAGLALTFGLGAASGPLLRAQFLFAKSLLGPTGSTQLAERVQELTETRAHATDAQAAELRRIERDLHDGAQARLVAVGMTLRTVERLLDTDPAAVRDLVVEARETSAAALQDLRDLVRGVHPPVLVERGLVDAVRAVALDTPADVTVEADLPGAPEPPIEAAVYFALCELLANIAKHADADHATVGLGHTGAVLRAWVTDDGRGGATDQDGGGLHGVRRRLATFDGTLTVASPPGGPTTVTLEVPCVLSSPKTSTSFGPGSRGC